MKPFTIYKVLPRQLARFRGLALPQVVKSGLTRSWGWEASNSTTFGNRSRSTSGRVKLPGKDRSGRSGSIPTARPKAPPLLLFGSKHSTPKPPKPSTP